MVSCVYKITNVVNGKVYIGQSTNIKQRFIRHRWELHHNRHTNIHLQLDWNTYGEENFTFDIVEECPSDILIEREAYWIEYYGGINGITVYNMLSSVDGHIQETRDKIHNTLHTKYLSMEHPTKGRIVSEEERLRMSNSRKGRKHSDITKEKIRQSNLGKHLSDETKEKIRQSKIGRPGPTRGRHLSDEHKAKIRKSHLGTKLSSATRKKLSEQRFNRPGRYVMQMSSTGECIDIYDSLTKAFRATGVNKACICEVCRGNQKHAGGFLWKYITKEEFDQYYNARD